MGFEEPQLRLSMFEFVEPAFSRISHACAYCDSSGWASGMVIPWRNGDTLLVGYGDGLNTTWEACSYRKTRVRGETLGELSIGHLYDRQQIMKLLLPYIPTKHPNT